jgi:TfoX/Sxy family transcriptional regulator of competence genes
MGSEMSSPRRGEPAAAAGADALVDRLRAALPEKGLSEQKMFGGTGFMLNGNMVAGTFRQGLLVRVGKDRHGDALKRPGASAMEMRGKAIEGYIQVEAGSLGDAALKDWVKLALAYVRTLPPKPAKPKSKPKRTKGDRK